MRSLFALFSLFLLALTTTTVTSKHAANTACQVRDLLEDCNSVVVKLAGGGEEKQLGELEEFLIDECQEFKGLLVAKCLMKYMCINHGEKAVDAVRDCVEQVCPLAKHMPRKVCHG